MILSIQKIDCKKKFELNYIFNSIKFHDLKILIIQSALLVETTEIKNLEIWQIKCLNLTTGTVAYIVHSEVTKKKNANTTPNLIGFMLQKRKCCWLGWQNVTVTKCQVDKRTWHHKKLFLKDMMDLKPMEFWDSELEYFTLMVVINMLCNKLSSLWLSAIFTLV